MAIERPLSYHVPLELNGRELAQAVGRMRGAALLEGGASFGASGRWSFFTAEPSCRLWSDHTGFHVAIEPNRTGRPDLSIDHGGDPLAVLDDQITRLGFDPHCAFDDENGPPFRGGLIGFFSYDLAPCIEKLPRQARRDSGFPDLGFGLYDTVAWIDHQTNTAGLSVYDIQAENSPKELRRRADAWIQKLREPAPAPAQTRLMTRLSSNFSREGYLEAVERSLEYIRAGDIFQVNLSQRFEATGEIDPLDLFLRLRRHSPAPFSAYLAWGQGTAVVSASPELFYETRGTRIVTRPIKGTRPRGRSPAEDLERRQELERSEKDRAELTMIVDLERNDLGRVCQYGSMRVAEPRTVESFAQVHHLVATVDGRLREGRSAGEVVRAVFPGGSITGAPKIRAMQIIDELEPNRRGLYTGAIGYYSRGASAFNIAIRTLLVEGNRVSYQVGGGIVADSLARAEYEETLHKGRGLREVIEGTDA